MRKSILILVATLVVGVAPAHAAENATVTFTTIEQKWVNAIVKRDAKALSAILANDWQEQGPSGKRETKADALASLKDPKDILTKATIHDVHVTLLSPTTAIVQGREDDIGSYHGKDTSGPGSFTDVFAKRGGAWVAVATQFTKTDKT